MESIDSSYHTLGIAPDAQPEAIRQAYTDLVRVWDPQRFTNDPELQQRATERLHQIDNAYFVIMSRQAQPDQSAHVEPVEGEQELLPSSPEPPHVAASGPNQPQPVPLGHKAKQLIDAYLPTLWLRSLLVFLAIGIGRAALTSYTEHKPARSVPFSSWTQVSVGDGKFTLRMPQAPKETTKSLTSPDGTLTQHIYSASNPDETCILSLVAFQAVPDAKSAKQAVDIEVGARKTDAESRGANDVTVIPSDALTGYPSQDILYHVFVQNTLINVKVRVFVSGTYLGELTYITPQSVVANGDENSTEFFNSLKVN